MDSPSYDLGSLCSSPLLYPEGQDFLGQPVNIFEDEDISFDFIDTFAADFSIAGNNKSGEHEARGEDQISKDERPTLGRNQNETQEYDSAERAYNEESIEDSHVFTSNSKNCDSIYDHTSASASECIEGLTNEVTNTSICTENVLHSSVLCKSAEDVIQCCGPDATENHALSQTDREINRVETDGRVDISSVSTISPGDLRKHFNENTYSNDNSNEKVILADNLKLSLHGAHKTSNKGTETVDPRKGSKTLTNHKGIDDSSFSAMKTSAFKRCIPQKTFYSPFWTPEKSTTKRENSLEDGLSNAQRNMDILYCCTCGSQKRDILKNTRLTAKNETGLRDGNKYTDFLKRKSVFRQQGNSRRPHNKAINGELSFHLDETGTNNEEWISLPAIYTSSKPKTAHHNRPISDSFSSTLSLTSIERLINKYKVHRFDLVEQQKRYKLKPFK